jgi:hypothetical protein
MVEAKRVLITGAAGWVLPSQGLPHPMHVRSIRAGFGFVQRRVLGSDSTVFNLCRSLEVQTSHTCHTLPGILLLFAH